MMLAGIRKNLRQIINLVGILYILNALSGCGGGSGGGITGNSQGADPVVVDYALAYVKRPVPVNNQGNLVQPDYRTPYIFNAGGDLFIRDRASPSATERNVTFRFTGGLGDVKDVAASNDGTKLIFAMRAPDLPNTQPENQPKWNIWEYTIATDTLQRVITSDITAEDGQDIAPQYLPDGRIVFASTRQREAKAILLDEGKPQFSTLDESRNVHALNLHVMSADGSNIKQITFNQSHDMDPSVLASGEIVFTRWDHMGGRNQMHLYKVRPDGTELQILYGAHSHATGTNGSTVQFLRPRQMSNGSLMALLTDFTGSFGGGDIISIDTASYTDNTQPIYSFQGSLTGPAQTSVTNSTVTTGTTPSPGGRFLSAYPLQDGTNRMLVSWSPCRLVENNVIVACTPQRLAAQTVQEASPLYGIYIYDLSSNTQLPIVTPQENFIITDVVAAETKTAAPALTDKTAGNGLDTTFISESVGAIHIKSVYDFDGTLNTLGSTATGITSVSDLADPAKATADQRAARFVRVVKAVSIPDRTVRDFRNTAFGRSTQQLMREIIGYAPIEPDGSVKIKVPANVPLAISILDKNGRRIGGRHRNWFQVKPGETLTCNGCHTEATGLPHAHSGSAPTINAGAPTTGLPFPNTVSTLWANASETMAETRSRISCLSGGCTALLPSVNLVYNDDWTDSAVRTPDTAFSIPYNGLTTAAPVSASCQTTWASTCRIVINYETHIHPLWTKDRRVFDINNNLVRDDTCTSCHTSQNMAGATVPAAQLDLTDGASPDQADHFKSYRELLFPDNAQVVTNGALVDQLVNLLDANGNVVCNVDANGNPIVDPITNVCTSPVQVPVTVQPAMTTAGATASTRFFSIFATGGTHDGRLNASELKLISEWLDIGAQYYNDPFAAPIN